MLISVVAEFEKKKKSGCGNPDLHGSLISKNDKRNWLTNLISFYSLFSVSRFKDIALGICQQTSRKCKELAKDREEMNSLREPYQRYRELSAAAESKERSIKIGFALMLNAPDGSKSEAYAAAKDRVFELFSDTELPLDVSDIELSEISLWRIIREVVRQTVEIRVFELEEHLKAFGVKASRPAIESALATHPKEFKITKRGREKFVSLKGA